LAFVKCDPPSACLGTTNNSYSDCSIGFTGLACGVCSPGFYKLQNNCHQCPSNQNSANALWFAMVIIAFFVCFFLLLLSKPSIFQSCSIGVAISFVQTVALYPKFNVRWHSTLNSAFDVFSFLNFNIEIFSPECSVKFDYWQKWYLKLFLPFFLAVLLAILYLILYILKTRCANKIQRAVASISVIDNNTGEIEMTNLNINHNNLPNGTTKVKRDTFLSNIKSLIFDNDEPGKYINQQYLIAFRWAKTITNLD
jgi:hypothetical protein